MKLPGIVVAVMIDNLHLANQVGGPSYQLPVLHEVDHGETQQVGQFNWYI